MSLSYEKSGVRYDQLDAFKRAIEDLEPVFARLLGARLHVGFVHLHDVGAGGISNALPELVNDGGRGGNGGTGGAAGDAIVQSGGTATIIAAGDIRGAIV